MDRRRRPRLCRGDPRAGLPRRALGPDRRDQGAGRPPDPRRRSPRRSSRSPRWQWRAGCCPASSPATPTFLQRLPGRGPRPARLPDRLLERPRRDRRRAASSCSAGSAPRRRGPRGRAAAVAGLPLLLLTIYLTGSRGGLLAAVIGTALMLTLTPMRNPRAGRDRDRRRRRPRPGAGRFRRPGPPRGRAGPRRRGRDAGAGPRRHRSPSSCCACAPTSPCACRPRRAWLRGRWLLAVAAVALVTLFVLGDGDRSGRRDRLDARRCGDCRPRRVQRPLHGAGQQRPRAALGVGDRRLGVGAPARDRRRCLRLLVERERDAGRARPRRPLALPRVAGRARPTRADRGPGPVRRRVRGGSAPHLRRHRRHRRRARGPARRRCRRCGRRLDVGDPGGLRPQSRRDRPALRAACRCGSGQRGRAASPPARRSSRPAPRSPRSAPPLWSRPVRCCSPSGR